MSAPKRIQLRRSKGWRKPTDAVVVTRATVFGNPFRVGGRHPVRSWPIKDSAEAVALFREALEGGRLSYRERGTSLRLPLSVAYVRMALQGRDLACWCPLDQPCHADVLLEIANAPEGDQPA